MVRVDPARLEWELGRRGMDWKDLQRGPYRVSSSTLTKIRAGEPVTMPSALKISHTYSAGRIVPELDAILQNPTEQPPQEEP
jgi:hypothetical protein